jgi:hypothetical protein
MFCVKPVTEVYGGEERDHGIHTRHKPNGLYLMGYHGIRWESMGKSTINTGNSWVDTNSKQSDMWIRTIKLPKLFFIRCSIRDTKFSILLGIQAFGWGMLQP